MAPLTAFESKDVFISYASPDQDRVFPIVAALEANGISIWLDRHEIFGGECYGPAIVNAIKSAKALLLMCSHASMRSRNVNQEIRLAWKYNIPYLPLLLDPIGFSEQVEYWLEGNQWIEVLDRPQHTWLPTVNRALERVGIQVPPARGLAQETEYPTSPIRLEHGLVGLRRAAKFTDQIWPVPAEKTERGFRRGYTRGLGAPQPEVCHRFRLGSRIRVIIEAYEKKHLLLLDESPDGIVYCLCPSLFAPDTTLEVGQAVFPQAQSRYDSFLVTGRPGREHLLAIITDMPLRLDWYATDDRVPARTLGPPEIDTLITDLRALDAYQWLAIATYFDVVPA